eukprot:SAG22_NODE_427_length_10603_cov_19.158225_4_plen_281_part_00
MPKKKKAAKKAAEPEPEANFWTEVPTTALVEIVQVVDAPEYDAIEPAREADADETEPRPTYKSLPGPAAPAAAEGEEEAAAAAAEGEEAEPVPGPTALRYETLLKATADDPLSVGVVLFNAEWCEPGQVLWPEFEKVCAKFGGLEPLPEPKVVDSDDEDEEPEPPADEDAEPPPPRKLKVPAFLFCAVDTESSPAAVEAAGVKCIPTIHLYRKGERAATFSGGKSVVKEFAAAVEELAEENGKAALALAEAAAAAAAEAAAAEAAAEADSPSKAKGKKKK